MELSTFHRTSPYSGFDHEKYKLDVTGWNFEMPTFDRLIGEVRPSLVIEVGTWKGGSAIRMADLAKEKGLKTKVVCVDTWLGSAEFWKYETDSGRYDLLSLCQGYPQVYFQFLANVVKTGHEDTIIPLPMTSLIAARLLAEHGVQADLIYIDASHDYEDVSADIAAYYPLVRPGGVIFGDDFVPCWHGVMRAVEECKHPFEIDGGFWVIRKP